MYICTAHSTAFHEMLNVNRRHVKRKEYELELVPQLKKPRHLMHHVSPRNAKRVGGLDTKLYE